MARTWILILGGVVLAVGAASWVVPNLLPGAQEPVLDITPQTNRHREDTSVGLCPWRDPDADRTRFFPRSTGTRDEYLILSRERAEVARRLGREPTGEDNALSIHRVLEGRTTAGVVITRRVRGESGVIELVLAVSPEGRVVGAKIQRLREPDAVARLLQSAAWLGAFRGKTADSDWRSGKDIPAVSEEARPSADAVLDGARTALILFAVGTRAADNHPHSHGT